MTLWTEGTFKALIIQMSLKSSSYATMALREVLKCDTSSQTHAAQSAAFHEAHEKNEEAKRNEEQQQPGSETDENARRVENLKLKDRNSDEDKTNISAASSSLEDSVIEDGPGKSGQKASSSMLEDSSTEDKSDANKSASSKSDLQKHEVDVINDSGIEPGSAVATA